MKLSIMVPVYNLEEFIGPCLESLLFQTVNFEYEIVVANDCSTDNSKRIIEQFQARYPGRIQLIDNAENQRLANNMKLLLAQCRGDYIAYMDGDDLAKPGKLQAQVDYLNNNPDCGMVYHDSEVFDSDSGKVTSHYVRDYYNREYIPDKADINHLILYGSFFNASSLMFRRHNHLEETVDDKCKIILDHPFQVLNAGFTQGKIGRIEAVLGGYRLHASSFGAQTLRNATRRERVLADQLQAISNGTRFSVDDSILQQGKSHYCFATALFFLKREDELRFRLYIQQSENNGLFFDERHQYLLENKDNFQYCLDYFQRCQ